MAEWTPDQAANRLLEDLIQRTSNAIPADRFSLYVMGSFATGEASDESDIDAAMIWVPMGNSLDLIGVSNAANKSRLLSGKRLDPVVLAKSDLTQPWVADKLPGLLSSALLIHGDDLLASAEMPTIETHLGALQARACSLMRNIRDGRPVKHEAFLPAPAEPFFGYTRRRTWYPATIPNGTREIVDLVAGLAAPLAVAATRAYVTGKRHAIELFSATAADPWASFVRAVYCRCAIDWRYRIPKDEDGRHLLSELCLFVHAFENHYVQTFPC